MTIPKDSALWTHGRLGPYVLTRFNVQEVEVSPGARVEVFADGIVLWQHPRSTFARSIEESRDFLSLGVAAYSVVSGAALDFTFGGWVEATEARLKGTTVGVAVEPRGHRPMMDPAGKRSVQMGRAIALAAAVNHRGGWRLALRDLYSAQLALERRSDDCFVFAYRAVEDLSHAVSQTSGKSWPALHTHLQTDETRFRRRIEPLRLARNAAGHGDETSPDLIDARAHRVERVRLARTIVRQAIKLAPYLPNP